MNLYAFNKVGHGDSMKTCGMMAGLIYLLPVLALKKNQMKQELFPKEVHRIANKINLPRFIFA